MDGTNRPCDQRQLDQTESCHRSRLIACGRTMSCLAVKKCPGGFHNLVRRRFSAFRGTVTVGAVIATTTAWTPHGHHQDVAFFVAWRRGLECVRCTFAGLRVGGRHGRMLPCLPGLTESVARVAPSSTPKKERMTDQNRYCRYWTCTIRVYRSLPRGQ